MRRVVFIAVTCTFAFVSVPVRADYYGGRVYWDRIDGYFSGNGGEFTLKSDGGPGLLLSNSAYAETTRGQDGNTESFQTFCVEKEEYVKQPMDIVVSTSWTPDGTPGTPQWGVGEVTPASHAITGGMAIGDDLNPQTAYLYYQFAKGILSDYDYLNTGVGRNVSAGELQKAIWFLEGEITSLVSGSQAEAWYDEAMDSGWTNIGDVCVLNSWAPGYVGDLRYKRQDQLYLTPVPGAVLLGMLGLGLVSLKLRRFA